MGIEKDGYTQGALFVLTPLREDWVDVLGRPIPPRPTRGSRGQGQPADPFDAFQLRAEYKGYGSWRVSLNK